MTNTMTDTQKQHLLAYLGYYTGAVDGIWGEQSRQATKALQRAHGLEEDGVYGDQTHQAAKDDVANDRFAEAQGSATGDFWEEIEFFDRSEFKCTCGGRGCNGYPAEPVEQLVRNGDAARKHFGKAAIVSSGVRCALRNRELPGSAANSLHLSGRAMDFAVTGVSSAALLAYVKTLPHVDEAYPIDDSYVHMGVQKY